MIVIMKSFGVYDSFAFMNMFMKAFGDDHASWLHDHDHDHRGSHACEVIIGAQTGYLSHAVSLSRTDDQLGAPGTGR